MSPEARRRHVERAVASTSEILNGRILESLDVLRSHGATDEELDATREWLEEQAREDLARLAVNLDAFLAADGEQPVPASWSVH